MDENKAHSNSWQFACYTPSWKDQNDWHVVQEILLILLL